MMMVVNKWARRSFLAWQGVLFGLLSGSGFLAIPRALKPLLEPRPQSATPLPAGSILVGASVHFFQAFWWFFAFVGVVLAIMAWRGKLDRFLTILIPATKGAVVGLLIVVSYASTVLTFQLATWR
jgi:hypothetical protein